MTTDEQVSDVTVDGDVALVKSGTPTKSLAVYIVTAFTKDKQTEVKLRGIGAGAVNQMVKAVISAKSRLVEKGIKVTFDSYYKDVKSKYNADEQISAIEFLIKFENNG